VSPDIVTLDVSSDSQSRIAREGLRELLQMERDAEGQTLNTRTTPPGVSVVIPTHNRARVVGRAIRSALAQTYQALEVIVVDDGSTDNTTEVVNGIRDERVRYIRHDRNLGGGAARNTGIGAANGQYVAFLDSDDEWMPQKLWRQIHVLEEAGPSLGAVCTGFVAVDGRGDVRRTRIPRPRDMERDELLAGNRVGTASTVLARRALLEAIGGFDTSLTSCQDWDMYLRLADRSRFGFVPEVLVRYYVGNGDQITSDGLAVVNGHMRLAQKYLEQSKAFDAAPRARHLYALGQRLVGLGYRFGAAEAIRFGRSFVWMAFRTNPKSLRYLAYYLASSNRFTGVTLWRRISTVLQELGGPAPSQLRDPS
jgi:glycosyltransferase involved in cell wall biosynthesis